MLSSDQGVQRHSYQNFNITNVLVKVVKDLKRSSYQDIDTLIAFSSQIEFSSL